MRWKRDLYRIISAAVIVICGILIFINMRCPKDSNIAYKTIISRRSIRRFKNRPIPEYKLEKIVRSALYAPSASNLQPWEFVIVREEEAVGRISDMVSWLKGRGAPPEQFSPVCYILILGNTRINKYYHADCAMACQNMLVTAWAEGIGSCTIGSVNRNRLRELIDIPGHLDIFLVVALGYPAEEPITITAEEGKISPKMAKDGKWIVPKRELGAVLHWEQYGSRQEK